jgi:GMP synthase-like glutamine amidotransferase
VSIKIAILDLYDGQPNQGMRCLQDILIRFGDAHQLPLHFEIFEVRNKNQVPGTDFDIYLSSGGPGSPLESEGSAWETNYFNLIDELEAINHNPDREDKKYAFFICHSFQLMCRYYQLGKVCKRKSTSFGIFPVNKTEAGQLETVLAGLTDPFFAVDSRDWQVIKPNEERFAALGSTLLALEKVRPNVELERCIMAIRFNEYFFGTQFHPEGDPYGMKAYLLHTDKKQQVIDLHGKAKYTEMLAFLDEPEKLARTQNEIIPTFLYHAVNALQEV